MKTDTLRARTKIMRIETTFEFYCPNQVLAVSANDKQVRATYVSTCVHSRGISKVIIAWYVHISSNPSNGYLYTQKVGRYNDDKIKLKF